jgi:hypothetical protein
MPAIAVLNAEGRVVQVKQPFRGWSTNPSLKVARMEDTIGAVRESGLEFAVTSARRVPSAQIAA